MQGHLLTGGLDLDMPGQNAAQKLGVNPGWWIDVEARLPPSHEEIPASSPDNFQLRHWQATSTIR